MRLRPFWFLTSVVFFATILSTLSTEQEVQNNSGNLPVQPPIKPSYAPSDTPSSSDAMTHVPSKSDDGEDGKGSKRSNKMPSGPSKSDDGEDGKGGKRPNNMPSGPSKSDDGEDGKGGKRPNKMPSSGRIYSPSLIYCDTPEPTCEITPSPTLEPVLQEQKQMLYLTSGILSVYDDVTPVKKAPKHLGAAVSTAQMSQWSTLFPPSPPSPLVRG